MLSQSRADRRVASCVLCSSLATAASSAAGSVASHSGGRSSSSAFASLATCRRAAKNYKEKTWNRQNGRVPAEMWWQ